MSLSRKLFDRYESVALQSVTSRRFNQAQMLSWLRPILDRGDVESVSAGVSAEGRTIPLITVGKGPTSVLLWSQMHGDETTATMALLDILNFFSLQPHDPLVSSIKSSLSILMIPMLNPDGAERFQRRTSQHIDMNRDALRLQTPEAQILRRIQAEQKPHFAFNLHDQDARYTVGQSTAVTAIALSAPPVDALRSNPEVRIRAKHLAVVLFEALTEFIPGHIARYDDSFEPRAFGDNFQRWGTSTVLVESGGWRNDPEKNFLRKLNFVGLLCALHTIAMNTVLETDLSVYESIPFNGKNLYDVILRNVLFTAGNGIHPTLLDIGLNLTEETDQGTGKRGTFAAVVDLGDLGTMGAFEEFECSGIALDAGTIDIDKRFSRLELLRLIGKQ